MTNRKRVALATLATLGLGFSASALGGGLLPDLAPQSTVDLCVAEIADYADYSDATRVRHEIESKHRRTVGHVLKIDTLVYDDTDSEAIREYATICAVGSGDKPVKFRIRENAARS